MPDEPPPALTAYELLHLSEVDMAAAVAACEAGDTATALELLRIVEGRTVRALRLLERV